MASEEQRHLSQARLINFMALNMLRKGLTDHACKHGFSGTSGLDPELGRFAIADPDGGISCNSIVWLTAGNVADQTYFNHVLNVPNSGFIDEADNDDPQQYAAAMARAMCMTSARLISRRRYRLNRLD